MPAEANECKGIVLPFTDISAKITERNENMQERSRNWVLTINYKEDTPQDDEILLEKITEIKGIVYTAFQLEEGELGTKHHQLYMSFKDAKSFETIKKLFPTAHIEPMEGTPQQASDYCTKEDTRIKDPVIRGELPIKGERTDLVKITEMLEDGCSPTNIRYEFPSQYLRYGQHIRTVYQEILEEKYQDTFREVRVIYLCDIPGAGKTRYVMEKYGYRNVYRVSDYAHPFDEYKAQDVIVFEEFRDSINIDAMLIYLDGYPHRLPARYGNKVACFTKAYVISNWDIKEQYKRIQKESENTYHAFLRRIKFIGNLESVKEFEQKIDNAEREAREKYEDITVHW